MGKKYKTISDIKPDKQLQPEQILKIQELIKTRPDMIVPISDICPNFWNVNDMGTNFQAALEEALANARIGQTVPILIMKNPENNPNGKEPYCIVDGYHRWTSHLTLGIPTIRAILLSDVTLDEAKFIGLMQNRVRGNTPDISIYEAMKGINLGNLDINIHSGINIPKIEVGSYTPPAPPESKPVSLNNVIESPLDASPPEEIPPEIAEEAMEAQAELAEHKEEIKPSFAAKRTIPLTLFPTQEERDEIMALLDKIKGKRLYDRNEEALLYALRTSSDFEKVENALNRDADRIARQEAEAKEKEQKKQERIAISAAKKAEKAQKKAIEKAQKPKKEKTPKLPQE